MFCTFFGLLVLAIFLINILFQGLTRIDWDFITGYPSRNPEKAGIITALVGTVLILFLTALIAVPLGIAAGVYLEEYAKRTKLQDFFEVNITNLAGVPSI